VDRSELRVELWPLDGVLPYANNPRVISKAAIEKVAASIKQFGFRQPIEFRGRARVARARSAAGSLGKKSARDARGGERESNCGAFGRRACPTSLKVLGVDDDGLAATELCGLRRRWSRLRCGTTGQPNLRRNGPRRPDEPGKSVPHRGFAGTGAKEPRWAAGGATVGRNIADDVEVRWWPPRINSAHDATWRM